MEEWKQIKDYECYDVSSFGRVRSLNYRNKKGNIHILKNTKNPQGYYQVNLGRNNIKLVHILVCLTFIGERPDGCQIDHIDRNPSNNNLSNLRYVTPRQNQFNRNFSEDRGLFQRNQYTWEVRLDNKNWGSFRKKEEAILCRNSVLNSLLSQEGLSSH